MSNKNAISNFSTSPQEIHFSVNENVDSGKLATDNPGNKKGKVLHDWVKDLTWKTQSVLISAQRGPDTHFCPNVKAVTKWIRRTTQQNADPSHTFMADVPLPSLKDIEYELEYCTMHFTFHFLYGLEIMAYKHPDTTVREKAMYYYRGIIEEVLHFNVETEEQMDSRLFDKI